MSRNIADALDALALIEDAVTATVDGTVFAVKRVHTYPLRASQSFADTPCFQNTWRIDPGQRGHGIRRLFYVVRAQLFINEADMDRGIEAATRMHMDFIDRLDANVTLKDSNGDSTVTRLDYRGADPTIGVAERNNISYQVLDMFVDLLIETAQAYT